MCVGWRSGGREGRGTKKRRGGRVKQYKKHDIISFKNVERRKESREKRNDDLKVVARLSMIKSKKFSNDEFTGNFTGVFHGNLMSQNGNLWAECFRLPFH